MTFIKPWHSDQTSILACIRQGQEGPYWDGISVVLSPCHLLVFSPLICTDSVSTLIFGCPPA